MVALVIHSALSREVLPLLVEKARPHPLIMIAAQPMVIGGVPILIPKDFAMLTMDAV